jgi:hypothetical protein
MVICVLFLVDQTQKHNGLKPETSNQIGTGAPSLTPHLIPFHPPPIDIHVNLLGPQKQSNVGKQNIWIS